VAARLTAKPGHKDFGLLTLWTQLRYDVAIRKTVSPTCFYPAPGVSSAIVNLVRQEQPADDCQDRQFFYALTKFAFAHRRKQLKTILGDAVIRYSVSERLSDLAIESHLNTENVLAAFRELGIDPRTRPEDLSVELWRRLAQALKD
jgi:16S rRNA (adenine1518-N6/adenine1519-N6)-dimethyltransferase